ncbi:MAG: M23 family metallopeptidase [Minisyncoccia bacterium]|jgi:murein DD-endopeptidase MepM/ murein hydrolase activator NlpD
MLKRIGFIFLAIFVIAIGYDVVATVAHALESGTLLSWFPAITPLPGPDFGPGGGFGGGGTSGLTTINFSIFDKGGDGYKYITQGYGHTPYSYMYIGDWHNGIDIAAVYGAPIHSPTAATVLAVGDQDDFCPRLAFGRFIVLEDNVNHLDLLFAHLADIDVQPGEAITKDQLIGTVGATGDETGPHLHFSIFESAVFSMAPAHGCGPYPQGHDVNPLNYLEAVYE